MRYAYNPESGDSITLDDLAAFVAEMRGHRELPGDTVVRAQVQLEIDILSGPRLRQLTADTEPDAPSPGMSDWNRAQRRANGQRGPRR